MLDELGLDPIPNSNSEVGDQNQHTGQSKLWANPIHNSNSRVNMQGGIKKNIADKLWTNPISNSNTRVST